jgi:hypothetical protein
MPSSTIGPDQNHLSTQQPDIKPARKTQGRKTAETRNGIVHRVLSRGLTDRKWSSLTPNHHYLEAYASGTFGDATKREATGYDREAFEDAQAAFRGWVKGPKPWKGMIRGTVVATESGEGFATMSTRIVSPGSHVWVEETAETAHWGPISEQPATDAPLQTAGNSRPLVTSGVRMTTEAINDAYELYADPEKPEYDLDRLKAALYEFAPMCGRRSKCISLLGKCETYLTPNDILADFLLVLFDRIEKGQYHSHARKFDHWIAKTWSRFFSEFKTGFHSEANLTVRVNEHDFSDENAETEERVPGELYRIDVDREQVKRESKKSNPSILLDKIYGDLEKPETDWGKLDPDLKAMLRAMRGGATKKAAAEAAGLSEDYGRKALQAAIASITDKTAILGGFASASL